MILPVFQCLYQARKHFRFFDINITSFLAFLPRLLRASRLDSVRSERHFIVVRQKVTSDHRIRLDSPLLLPPNSRQELRGRFFLNYFNV